MPFIELAILGGGTAVMAAITAAKVTYDLWNNVPPVVPLLPPPPPETAAERDTRLQKEKEAEEARLKQEEEDRQARLKREAEERRKKEAEAKRQAQIERQQLEEEKAAFFEEQKQLWDSIRQDDFRLRDVIETLTQNIKFTGRKILVGQRVTGDKFMGVTEEEVPYPCHDIQIRQIKGFEERHLLLPSERAYPPQILQARISSGQALVQVHIKQTPQMEEVYEPVYETEIKMLYFLLDVSPSMWDEVEGKEWRVPLWRGITMRLIERALASGAPCVGREFSETVRDRHVIMNTAQARRYRNRLWNMSRGNGTRIDLGIKQAIKDLQKAEYRNADIMLITDGEDSKLVSSQVRRMLDKANIKLHAVMLGVNNANLRDCCDMFQVVEHDLTIHPLVNKQSAPTGN